MEDEDKTAECQHSKPPTGITHEASPQHELQEERVMSLRGTDGSEPTEGSNLLTSGEKKPQDSPTEPNGLQSLRRFLACPPQGCLARVITNGTMVVLLWAMVWSVTGPECLPGGNLFGITILFYCSITGGKLFGLIKFPTLPPLPPLLGMLLAGFLLRNIPVISDSVRIQHKWSSSLRSIALSVILVRAGLGLDSKALKKLKGVCVRLAMGPCIVEACASAILSHFLMGLPWQWGFILGFVVGAVSPAVVVPSMLLLQEGGYGVGKGIPTLLMAAGSFDDILAITGFNTCLGVAFSTGSTVFNIFRGILEVVIGVAAGSFLGFFVQYFPSRDQVKEVIREKSCCKFSMEEPSRTPSSKLDLQGVVGNGPHLYLADFFIAAIYARGPGELRVWVLKLLC